jgi:hypothetical protein
VDISSALVIIESLAEGIDPVTKKVFPADSPYHQPCVIRALYTVARELRRPPEQVGSATGALGNAWKPWGPTEEKQLREEFAARMPVPEIAKRHGRTRLAILGRLYRIGLLSAADSAIPGAEQRSHESQATKQQK